MSHVFYIHFAISRLWKLGYYHFQFNKLLQYALMPDQHNRYQLFCAAGRNHSQTWIQDLEEYGNCVWTKGGDLWCPKQNTGLWSGCQSSQCTDKAKCSLSLRSYCKEMMMVKIKKGPNKCVYLQGGEKVSRRGYWGDIVASPFLAFGIQSEDKSFFKKSNNMYTKVLNLSVRFGV